MSFLVKAAPAKKPAKSSKALLIWRGVKDIWPKSVNHRHNGDGIFGTGTYYAISENTALQYATGAIGLEDFKNFALVFGYSLTPKKPIELSPLDFSGLESGAFKLQVKSKEAAQKLKLFSGERLEKSDLGNRAAAKGFDCIILKSAKIDDDDWYMTEIDGDEQLLIPTASKLEPKLVEVDLVLRSDDEDFAEKVAKSLKTTVRDENELLISIPLAKLSALQKMLEEFVRNSASDSDDDDDD